jgi:hypothetical protein
MALTPAEQAELNQLTAQQQDKITQEFGDPIANSYADAVAPATAPPNETHSSIFRTIFGGLVRDPLAETVDTLKSLGADATKLEQSVTSAVGGNVSHALGLAFGALNPALTAAVNFEQSINASGVSVPNLPGSENAGTFEKVGRGILSFVVPFASWSKALSGEEAALTIWQKIGKGALAGTLTDFTSQDPHAMNLASALKEGFGLDSPTLDALAYHADDDDLVNRLKAATTNIPVGIAAEGLFELGAKGIRAYQVWRGGAPEEAAGIVKAVEHDYGIKRPKEAEAKPADALNPEEGGTPSTDPFDHTIHSALQENPPKTWEDVISFLNRIVDTPGIDKDVVDELSKIAHEDPENALTRLGIDPAKLDYEAFDNPEGVQNLHKALINIYEKVGAKLGRTGVRVSEADVLHTAARSFASDADILRVLFGRTKQLPELLMGARMFVGGHAKRLLDDAEGALNALRAGGEGAGDQEWQKFLATFYRHALYMGELRGAGSEIGRALKSLQFIARHDPAQAEKYASQLESRLPRGASATAEEDAQSQVDSLVSMDSDAERMMVLSKLLEKQGDVGALAAYVRRMNGSIGKQIDAGVREGVGNLFSAGTAAYNFGSTMTFLGLRALGRWMSAGMRAPLALVSAEQARLFRIAKADAWAYQDGLMLSWGEAWRNMLTAVKADMSTELFLNADNLGLKTIAKHVAEWNAEGSKLSTSGKNFERVDMRASQHVIALSPSDRRAIDAWAEHYDMPKLMEGAMKWMARTAGVAINALGTATRMGTILFVNAPDQLAGSLAYKAGSQSAAVREAANRAAELGIEGKTLSKYLKARVASLTADVGDHFADQAYEAGFRDTVHTAGEHEARSVLFQDRLETGIGRGAEWLVSHTPIFGPLFVPFVHTPMRILERSLIDYSPLGVFKSRIRTAILSGTPEQREQALSQMALGLMGFYMGYHLASNRTIVGKDGTFFSTARMARESYTFQVGGDTFEFNRLDPMATILGLAADYHQYMNSYYDPNDPEASSKLQAMAEAAAWAISANVLSKSYLESIRNLTEMAGAFTDGEFKAHFDKYVGDTLARRFVPAAGIQKGIRQTYDPYEHEAITFYDKVIRESLGATSLPVKRDWLGEPVTTNFGERFTGLDWEPYRGNEDPLVRELDTLSLDTKLPRKDINGVPLNVKQYTRLLELRGQVVTGDYGTMKNALHALIQDPRWPGLTPAAKEEQVRLVTQPYTHLATNRLRSEDLSLEARIEREQAYQDAKGRGLTPEELNAQTEKINSELAQYLRDN